MDNRPPTSAGNRPLSGFRPFTSSQRPPTSNVPTVPGTASRLITAANNRPGTRGSIAQGVGLMSQIMVSDRPMTQQGLVAPKTSQSRSSQRLIQDKSYFMALLRSKMTELANEINRLAKENEDLTQEHSTYLTYEKKAEGLAAELKELQGEMADYNLLVDKLNTDAETEEVQEEYKELKAQNDQESRGIELLFEQRQEKESKVKHLEREIEQERHMADNLISAMKPELRQKFAELKQTNQNLVTQLDKLQQQMNTLSSQKSSLEEEVSLSAVKQEAVKLYERLRELEDKKNSLLEEERTRGTPAQERERLLQQVKEDNAELASIEHKMVELKEQIAKSQDELSQLELELDDHYGERSAKYRELKKREETMDAFLGSFEETRAAELARQGLLQANIVALLELISRNMSHFQQLPTQQEYSILKDDLMFKEGEMEKSRSTVTTLDQEQKKLGMDLQKIEQLEAKIQQELDSLRQKIKTMEEELVTYNDLDKLKATAEEKKKHLTKEKEMLQARRNSTKVIVSELKNEVDTLKSRLNDNETFTQLTNLERRWQHHEQNNFAMREYIASKMAENNYKPQKQNVNNLLDSYNKALQDNLSRGGPLYN